MILDILLVRLNFSVEEMWDMMLFRSFKILETEIWTYVSILLFTREGTCYLCWEGPARLLGARGMPTWEAK